MGVGLLAYYKHNHLKKQNVNPYIEFTYNIVRYLQQIIQTNVGWLFEFLIIVGFWYFLKIKIKELLEISVIKI